MIPDEQPPTPDAGRETENLVADPAKTEALRPSIEAALKKVYDPEIPVDIYELGLVYKVDVSDNRDVLVEMTLTAPGCPVAGEMPGWVQEAIEQIPDIGKVTVELVFDPPWDPSRMSDEAKLQLNMF
jgi:FeS assembly SUF system protein